MCGIVASIGNLNKGEQQAFEQLLFVDTLRGEDSTGLVAVNYQDKASFFKRAFPASDFLNMKQVQTMLFTGKVLIGHNRWATKGAINHQNAHPFQHGHIMGVHNGTLRNQNLLPDAHEFPVDSDNIYHSISKMGVEHTVKNLNGAFALVWYDEKEKKMKVIRNKERPLHYTFTKGSKQLFIASEAWMLTGILGRNGIEHGKVMSFKEDHLYVFSLPEKGVVPGASIRKLETYTPPVVVPSRLPNIASFPAPHAKPVQIFESVAGFLGTIREFTVGSSYTDKYGKRYMSLLSDKVLQVGRDIYLVRVYDPAVFPFLEEARVKKATVRGQIATFVSGFDNPMYVNVVAGTLAYVDKPEEKKEEPKKAAFFPYKGFRGADLTEKQWLANTRSGCAWCTSPPREEEVLTWISNNEFICDSCMGDEQVSQYVMQ